MQTYSKGNSFKVPSHRKQVFDAQRDVTCVKESFSQRYESTIYRLIPILNGGGNDDTNRILAHAKNLYW